MDENINYQSLNSLVQAATMEFWLQLAGPDVESVVVVVAAASAVAHVTMS